MAAAAAVPPDPTNARGLLSRCLSPGASEEAAAAHSLRSLRAPPPLPLVPASVRGAGGKSRTEEEGEEAPLRSPPPPLLPGR